MKKLIALLMIALLALTPAMAEWTGTETTPEPPMEIIPVEPEQELPQELPDREQPTGEYIELVINGERVTLDFDSSDQYSSIQNGVVQASFFAYSQDKTMLFELYMIFPETAKPGMVITPDYSALISEESSVVLIVSDVQTQQEVYYFSSLMDGTVYPENSSYAIAIDDILEIDGATSFSGRLAATLISLDMTTGEALAVFDIAETPFRFTIGEGEERHEDPKPTEAPRNDDMRKT